jgi:ferrochelatase
LVPIGFTSDHIEVQYGLDTQAAAKAEQLGIPLTRAKTVGSHHMFIKMIRELIEEHTQDGTPLALGSMGPQPPHRGETHCLRS